MIALETLRIGLPGRYTVGITHYDGVNTGAAAVPVVISCGL